MALRSRRPGHVPLERALSKLGLASRTQARELILAGKVRVDGAVKNNLGFQVVPERARIEIDGERVARAKPRTFVLHKTRGVVTTRSDEKGRPTVFSLIREPGLHLNAVGRLDMATTGLLLLTNDTRLADFLTDPKNGIPRTYLVSVRGRIGDEQVEKLQKGFTDDGDHLRAQSAILRKASGRESHLTVTLTEGKNREIRRMFLALGHEVTRLKRVAFGTIELGDLPPGEYRELTPEEIARLTRSTCGEASGTS